MQSNNQMILVITFHPKTRSLMKPRCVCPFSNCNATFCTNRSFREHLKLSHELTNSNESFNRLLDFYTTDYYLNDVKVFNSEKFAHVCLLCKKKKANGIENFSALPSFTENQTHILNHIGFVIFGCSSCNIWFSSEVAAGAHLSTYHDSTVKLCTIDDVFKNELDCLKQWMKFSTELITICHESFALNAKHQPADSKQLLPAELEFMRLIHFADRNSHSLRDFKGSLETMFKTVGNWEKTGRIICASSTCEVDDCLKELSSVTRELIFHKCASISLASLLFRSSDSWWNQFIEIVKDTSIRKAMYTSTAASQLVRKLLTANNLSNDRFMQLASSFIVNDQFETAVFDSPNAGLFFTSFASRPGTAAITLCRYASQHVSLNQLLQQN